MAPTERAATFHSSEQQEPPQGDNRYRINLSAKFYVAQLLCGTKGCTLNISESAERVVHAGIAGPEVLFEAKRHALRSSRTFKSFIDGFIRRGCTVYVGGIHAVESSKLESAPYIFVSGEDLIARFEELHPPR